MGGAIVGLLAGCGRSTPERGPAPVAAQPEAVAPLAVVPTPAPNDDATMSTAPSLEIVATPLSGYERLDGNIGRTLWDLEYHDELVFLGYGDGTANTGPTDILAYDPRTATHHVETTIDEEAVMTFRRFGERLYVPGADPLGRADNGALHVREGGAWRKVIVPDAVHVFDAMVWQGRLFVALQERPNRAVVLESSNDGATWRRHAVPGWRANVLFTVQDRLLVSSFGGGLAQLEDGAFGFVASPLRSSAPPITDDNVDTLADDSVVIKAARCADTTWTIAMSGSVGLGYASATLGSVHRDGTQLVITNAWLDGQPEDLFVWGGRCHVVTNDSGAEQTTIRIYRSEQAKWELVVETSARAIARSAMRVDDHYYLGLGCEPRGCGQDAGALARLRVSTAD